MRNIRIPEDVLIPGNIFYHFKGKFYSIISISKHTETGELMVNYEPLFKEDGETLCSRPAKMFLSDVDAEKYPQYAGKKRFKLILDRHDRLCSRIFDIGIRRMLEEEW